MDDNNISLVNANVWCMTIIIDVATVKAWYLSADLEKNFPN